MSELLLPEVILTTTAVAVIIACLFWQKRQLLVLITVIGLLAAAGASILMWNGESQVIYGLLQVDRFALFFKLVFISGAILVVLSSADYSPKLQGVIGEYLALICFSTLGMMLMASSINLVSLFLSLEMATIPLYILSGLLQDKKSTEASLKYVLIGGIASAVLLYGMALVFGFTGELGLKEIGGSLGGLSAEPVPSAAGLIVGVIMIIGGFGFKIAAVPFHMWAPDVYEGAPTPVTAFISTASKVAGLAIIMRTFVLGFSEPQWLSVDWGIIFAALATVSMSVGNLLALRQENIKRLLAYSSIAHSGYLLIGLSCLAAGAGEPQVLFYAASFLLSDLTAFIAVIAASGRVNSDMIAGFAGLGRSSPLVATALTLGLISLAGLPVTSGFMAKLYLFTAAASSGLMWLVIVAVLNTVLSVYYYFRVVRIMWLETPRAYIPSPHSKPLGVALIISSLGILALGIAPALVMQLATAATIIP